MNKMISPNMLTLIILHILCYILVILSLIGTGLFCIYRYLVGLYLSYKYKQPIQFSDGRDTIFSIDDEKCRYVIGAYRIIKGRADIDKIRQRFEERWLQPRVNGNWKYGKLRKQLKQELGYFFWIEQEEFRLENYVVLHDGPVPENKDEYKKFCAETLSNLPINKGISWQFVFVNLPNNLTSDRPDPHFLVIPLAYHGLLDGISLIRMLSMLFDDAEESNKISTINLMDKVIYWGRALIFGPYEFISDLLKSEKNHLLHGQKLSGERLVSFSHSISKGKVKRIENMTTFTNLTVNEILIACVVGGFRSYFLWKNEVIPREMNFKIPVSFHNLQNEVKVENNTTTINLVAPVDEPNRIERLLKTKTAMAKLKNSPYTPFLYLVLRCSSNRIPLVISRWLASLAASTSVVSCIPMLRSKSFLGNEVVSQNICLTIYNGVSGCGLAVGIPSEGNDFMFTITADSAIIKSQENLDKLIEFMVKEVDGFEKEF